MNPQDNNPEPDRFPTRTPPIQPRPLVWPVAHVVPATLLLFSSSSTFADPPAGASAPRSTRDGGPLAKGDEVVAGGGILGRVTDVSESYITVEIADGVAIKVQRPACGTGSAQGYDQGRVTSLLIGAVLSLNCTRRVIDSVLKLMKPLPALEIPADPGHCRAGIHLLPA